MIVRARSPYIIFINEAGQTSGKLELRIWRNGEPKPTLPTYSFTKSIPSPTQTLLRFNISPYLKDFISNKLNDVNTWYCNFECRLFSNNVELTAQKVEGIAVNGYTTFLQGQNATVTAQDLKNSIDNLQIGGRNYYPDGDFSNGTNQFAGGNNVKYFSIIPTDFDGNPLPWNGSKVFSIFTDVAGDTYGVLTSLAKVDAGNYMLSFYYKAAGSINENSSYLYINSIPYGLAFSITNNSQWHKVELPINISSKSDIQFRIGFSCSDHAWINVTRIKIEKGNKATDWTPAPEDEQYRFSYIKRQIKVGSTNKLHYYDRVLNEISEITDTNVEETCEPILEPQLVQFINRYGGLDFIWFFKMRTDSISIESKEYKLLQQGMYYDTTIGQNAKYNFNGKQSIKMNTGFVNENYNELIQDLMLSEKVWINSIPAIVKSSGTEFKTQIRNKNINYEIEFEYAFDLINNMQ